MRRKRQIELSTDSRQQAVASIKRLVQEELGQEVGDLKAGIILDYFLAEIGPLVYNGAISDARRFFNERSADLEALCHHDEFTYWPSASRRRP
jgi:uncharacterized protein (DUF2164 family)